MMKSRKDLPTVRTFADHEIITPQHPLARFVVITNNDMTPDLDPIARAEAALDRLSHEFDTWMHDECDRLDRVRARVIASGLSGSAREDLFRAAHDIKGQAVTFGYPHAADAAESLCRVLDHAPDPQRVPIELINQHVDGVCAIIRENERDRENHVAQMLATTLRRVADEFLAVEIRENPTPLRTVRGPRLVPRA
jgi:HPt (histidine-containing phosphotransfer) domain-containing protein